MSNKTALNYMTDGGDKWVVGGALEVKDNNALIIGDKTLSDILKNYSQALSGDIAFKCIPATVNAEIDAQNIGTQQTIVATIGGAVTEAGGGTIDVTVVADGLDGGEKTVAVTVANSDDDEAVALAIKTALEADADIGHTSTGMFTVTVSGAVVTLTKKNEAANDTTMDFSVEADTAVFVEGTPLSVSLAGVQGAAPYTRDVTVQLVDSDGDIHTWFSGIVPVTIADTADGTASVVGGLNPVMTNGVMTVTVELQGVWAANKTNTLSVSQKTILGNTVTAKTSVETSVDTSE